MEENKQNHLILIGFMGAGKTTVGMCFAETYGWPILDTDRMIEEEAGMAITRIFETSGEEKFRQTETTVLENLFQLKERSVISVGGGMPLREENNSLLRQLGTVVYLRIRSKTVLRRLKGDTTRPLLQGERVEERVEELLDFRKPIYEKAAHAVIDVDKKSVADVVEELAGILNVKG